MQKHNSLFFDYFTAFKLLTNIPDNINIVRRKFNILICFEAQYSFFNHAP